MALSGRQKQLSTAGMAFFTLLAAVVALAFYRALLSYEAGAPTRAIYKKQAAEAPSMANLPDLKPMSLNEALILDNNSGEYSAGSPWLQNLPAFKPVRGDALVPSPAIIVYSVLYQGARQTDARIGVSVWQYPNSDWARFSLRYASLSRMELSNPETVQTVSKLGNTILARITNGQPEFYWVSGNVLVSLTFTGAEPDSLLKVYLNRYPSSL